MRRIALADIVTDAGTQIRAAINEAVVTEYAERMTEGVTFPAVVLFHDGNQYFLADGFHRVMAASRNQFRDIDADVRQGTQQDALWFALGANKANGHRMTEADKKHAVLLALKAWPERSGRELASHVGCANTFVSRIRDQVCTSAHLPDRVTGKDGKSYPATRPTTAEKRAEIQRRVEAGEPAERICSELNTSFATVTDVRKAMGLSRADNVPAQKRWEEMQRMASAGYSSMQIASALGLSLAGCRQTLHKRGIDVPADRAIRKTRRHDGNRIVDQMVMDAEHLTADVNLIVFADLDRSRLSTWVTSLESSRVALNAFIRRLKQEQQSHGEAAHSSSVEDPSGADRADADSAGPRHTA